MSVSHELELGIGGYIKPQQYAFGSAAAPIPPITDKPTED